jgi:hypothetical protein
MHSSISHQVLPYNAGKHHHLVSFPLVYTSTHSLWVSILIILSPPSLELTDLQALLDCPYKLLSLPVRHLFWTQI